ncbi:hypothetical protein [Candidatus Vondammii sp. HM_W22]|uniref:hypothetical protein n=1 Tax=Candidatus Vondammii sp. HM_W22 TaxID=2687299 RepID=UPI001F12CD5B|nr:hypothetical protein [Candidatus Vondammii sp. HM_W22]
MKKQIISSPRFLTFSLMAIMVLGQLYLLSHQIKHTLESDDHACSICELADHQLDSLIVLLPVVPTIALSDRPQATDNYSYSDRYHAHYLSRAPPASICI